MIKSEILKRLEKIELALNNEGKQKKIIQIIKEFAELIRTNDWTNEEIKKLIKEIQ